MMVGLSLDEKFRILELVGVECHVVKSEDEALVTFKNLLGRAEVLVVDEDLYEKLSQAMRREIEDARKPPLIVVIPSFRGPRRVILKELRKAISKAVGVELVVFKDLL